VHIPDGFLATPVWLGLDVVSAPAIALLARRAQHEMEEARAPLLGVMGAFVFAAQMVNFPVAGGTSAHLLGGALLAIVLGPAAACVVMTAILAVQAFVFQDGGILALGANVLNMAIAGVLAGYLPYRLWGAGKHRRAAIVLAAALSVVVSAILALGELAVSGVAIPPAMLRLSLVVFAASAIVEGAITLAVIEGIEKFSPRLVRRTAPRGSWGLAAVGAAAFLLASVGAVAASASPDAIQKLLGEVGGPADSTWLGKAALGVAGLALIGIICAALGRLAARARSA
jgi:cobalt/nickel transport system permease protein